VTLADLDYENLGSVVCVRLTGEIDMSNADNLREAITTVTPNDARGLIVDLTDVEYLDSAGIHLIYRLREGLHRRGLQLRLVIPEHSVVNDALRLAGIRRHEEIVETVAAAREGLEADQAPSR
jgi:anti-anti-sigma factor